VSRDWLGHRPLCERAPEGAVDWSELGERQGEPLEGNHGPAGYQRRPPLTEAEPSAEAPTKRRSGPLAAVVAVVLVVWAVSLWMHETEPRPAQYVPVGAS